MFCTCLETYKMLEQFNLKSNMKFNMKFLYLLYTFGTVLKILEKEKCKIIYYEIIIMYKYYLAL